MATEDSRWKQAQGLKVSVNGNVGQHKLRNMSKMFDMSYQYIVELVETMIFQKTINET